MWVEWTWLRDKNGYMYSAKWIIIVAPTMTMNVDLFDGGMQWASRSGKSEEL